MIVSIFYGSRDQLRPGSLLHKRKEPGNEVANSAEYKSTHLYITEYSSGFLLLLVKQAGTQHVKSPFLLLVLVDKIGLLPLLSGLHVKPLKTRARVLKRTRV